MRRIVFYTLVLICHGYASAAESNAGHTYFVEIRNGVPPITLLASSRYTARPVSLMYLQPGDIIRVQMNELEFAKHFNFRGRDGNWVEFNSGAPEKLKIWAEPSDILLLDAYKSKLLLRPRQNDARVFNEPTLTSWNDCHIHSKNCLRKQVEPNELELVDSKIIAGDNEPRWSLIYKVRWTAIGGILHDGWVRAIDFEQGGITRAEGVNAPALVDDLLSSRMDRAQVSESYIPPPPSVGKYHLDFTPEIAQFSLNSETSSGLREYNTGAGVRVGLLLQAPLLYDFSTNIFTNYAQVINPEDGGDRRYSQFGMGGEMLYGVGSTEAKFKLGLGVNTIIFNNAPVGFRILAGGLMSFIYEGEKYFASYRGGPMANSATGIKFSNYEILVNAGVHLDEDRHGWSIVASYNLTDAHAEGAVDRISYTVWTLGISYGL